MSDEAVPRTIFEEEMERRVNLFNQRTEINIQLDWMREHFYTTQTMICRMGDSCCSKKARNAYATIIRERIEEQVKDVSKLQNDLISLLKVFEDR